MLVKRISIRIVCSIFISILLSTANLAAIWLIKQLIDQPSLELVKKLAFVWSLSLFLPVLKNYIFEIFFLEEGKNFIKSLLKTIFSFSFSFIESKQYHDDFDKIKDKNKQEKIFLSSLEKITFAVFAGIGFYILLYYQVSTSIFLLLLISFLFTIILSGRISRKLSDLMYDYWENYKKNTRKYQYLSNVLVDQAYIEEKKVYSYFSFFSDKFCKEFDMASEKNRILGKKRIKLELLMDGVFLLFSLWFFFLFFYAYRKNQVTIGLFVSATGYMLTLFGNFSDAVSSIEDITKYIRLEKDVLAFSKHAELEMPVRDKKKESDNILELKQVNFQYKTQEKMFFHGISFCFQKGKKYAVIGANGSGKTTLAKLLAGLYVPQSGSIVQNGKIVVLFQDFNRYPMTLEENITLSNSLKEKEKFYEIKVKSGLKKRVEKMKQKEKTELTTLKEGGEELSGGEWQRIALARILWSDGDIFILDEPTANLDPMEEIRVFEIYQQLLMDKTVIYITHRLGFVKNVDEIIVLENGTIAEVGTHRELFSKKDSLYKKMYKEQKDWYE